MLLVLAFVFLLVHVLPWLGVMALRPAGMRRDVFAPLYLVTLLNLLNFPYLFLLGIDRSNLAIDTLLSPWTRDVTASVAGYVLVACVGFTMLVVGLFSPFGPALAAALPRLAPSRFTRARCNRAIVVTACAGVAGYALFLAKIGGLTRLWMLLYNRTLITGGTGYIAFAYALLFTFFGVLLAYSLRFRRTLGRRVAVGVGLLTMAVVLASTGGRTGAIFALFYAMLTVHYAVRPVRRLVTPGTTAVGAVLFVFILIMPLFRTTGATQHYLDHPDLLATDAFRGLNELAPQFSLADEGMVIVRYFTPDRLWLGASYLDLLMAPIPRTLIADKPPVDEGVYLMAITQGYDVRPSMPASQLPVTAWPMANWVMYMNFGLPGFMAAMFLSGVMIAAAYRYMQLGGYTPMGVYLYGVVATTGFSLSNLGLVTFIITVGFTALVFTLLFGRLVPAFGGRAPRPLAAAAG
jgi:hypothetical protein